MMSVTIHKNSKFGLIHTNIFGMKYDDRVSDNPRPKIIDIRCNALEINLKEELVKFLESVEGVKSLPTTLLYDERGLHLFEKITYLDEYYLTNTEIEVLRKFAHEIAGAISSGSMVVELGSGNLRKVGILLQALEEASKEIDYYALDLSLKELYRTLGQVPPFKHVRCHGLYGTYDDGLKWLKIPENMSRPKCILSLGSSIGNFRRQEAEIFLKEFSGILQPADSMLIGLDNTYDAVKVYHAYNDRKNCTHEFILNGLKHANDILGEEVFKSSDWDVIGEFVYDDEGCRHQALYTPNCDFRYKNTLIKAGERIEIERSLKYSSKEASRLWKFSGLSEAKRWSASTEAYSLYLLVKNNDTFNMNPEPSVYAASAIPTLKDWDIVWDLWKTVTREMIPDTELNQKPINLRHPFIFYLGHIPTFLDLQISKVTKQLSDQTLHYAQNFERGIDPDVDNPQFCHSHSQIPAHWPPVEQILKYQDTVHKKVMTLYEEPKISRSLARSIWVGFEHEVMHLETILYMLLQSKSIIPPPNKAKPDFKAEAIRAKAARNNNQWFYIPGQTIKIGLDDPEDNSSTEGIFGWDNEKPSRSVEVPPFEAQARPITNEDVSSLCSSKSVKAHRNQYASYLYQTRNQKTPASWTTKNTIENDTAISFNTDAHGLSNDPPSRPIGQNLEQEASGSFNSIERYLEDKYVKSVYGPIPLEYALDWPVIASFDELSGYARWKKERIPTFEEVRSIYSYANTLKSKKGENSLARDIPVVDRQPSKDCVREDRLKWPLDSKIVRDNFINLDGANVGFKNWHPVAVTGKGNVLAGQAEMGGVWEWTSSPLERHEGFEPMRLYPEYTADFFDGKHNIVLGGSWATLPRIAGRKTFVNWYQKNYAYAWAGARLVRNVQNVQA